MYYTLLSMESLIKKYATNHAGQISLKRTLLMYTWIWTVFAATGILIEYLVDPTELFVNGLTGIATIIGIPITTMYIGVLWGEKNNTLPAPNIQIPSIQNNQSSNREDPNLGALYGP